MIEQVKQIVREASEIIKRAGDIAENTMAKEGTANYVTKYDLEVQKFLMKRLSETFEGCHFIGEEAGCDEEDPEELVPAAARGLGIPRALAHRFPRRPAARTAAPSSAQ